MTGKCIIQFSRLCTFPQVFTVRILYLNFCRMFTLTDKVVRYKTGLIYMRSSNE
jgi:hypothetical protein